MINKNYKKINDFDFSIKGLIELEKDRYIIYENSNVYDNKKKRFIKKCLINQGYYVVHLCDNNKNKHTILLHHLVAYIFLIKPNNKIKYEIDHIDSNKLNNNLSNLQYITKKENLKKRNKRSCYKKITLDFNIIDISYSNSICPICDEIKCGDFCDCYD